MKHPRTAVFLLLASLVCLAPPAEALNLLRYCWSDLKDYCKGIKPGEGRLEMCLREHAGEITERCRDHIGASKPVGKPKPGAPSSPVADKDDLQRLEPVWIRRWRGNSAKGGNNAWDVAVYKNRVYAIGRRTDKDNVAPLVFEAYTPDGKVIWSRTWEGYHGKHGTGAAGAQILGHGNFLYIGGAVASGDMNASLIQKWDTDGNLIWSEHWGDKPGGHHEVNGLAIVGNYLYVSHYSAAEGMITIDANIKKFDLKKLDERAPLSESMIWSKSYGKADSHNTTDGDIYADETGVYICGQYGGTKGRNVYDGGDAYLVKFDPNGNQKWIKFYTGNGSGTDNAFSLTSDGKHIFVTGPTVTKTRKVFGKSLIADAQVFVQKYTMDGTVLWTKLFGGPKIEFSRGIAVDDEDIFVTASTKSYTDGKDNTLLLKIDKNSGALVSQRIWGGKGIDGATTAIALGEPGYLYLSGNTTSSPDGADTGQYTAVVMKVKR